MEGIGQFDHSSKEPIPRYDRNGRLYTEDQRKQIADRRGLCVRCGITTHEKTRILGRKPVSNENVYEGTCIRCNPRKVPQHIYDAWDAKNRPQMTAAVTAVHPSNAAAVAAESSTRRGHYNTGHNRSSSSGSGSGANTPKKQGSGKTSQSSATSSQSHGNQRTKNAVQQQPIVTSSSAGQTRSATTSSSGPSSSTGKQAQFQSMSSSSFPPRGQFTPESQESSHYSEGHRHSQVSSHGSAAAKRAAQDRSGLALTNEHFFDNSVARGLEVGVPSTLSVHGGDSLSSRMSADCHPIDDSQRSILSTGTYGSSSTSSKHHESVPMTRDGHEERQPTAFENEKAALGIRRMPPATVHGVQSFSNRANSANDESSDNLLAADEAIMSPVENEKAALGIFRPAAPATKPGVDSYSSAAAFSNTSEPLLTVKTTTSVDPKASYRSAPASKPGVQSVVTRGVPPARSDLTTSRSDQSLRASRSDDDIEDSSEFVGRSAGLSKVSGSSDLKLSLQDDYKGDEVKLPTVEYMRQLAENLDDPGKLRRVLHNLRNIEDDDQSEVLHQIKVILSHCASDPRVGDVAVGVLWRTAAVSVDAKVEVMQSGAIDVVLDCLRQQSEDHEFCQWVLGVLTSVAFHMENKELIGNKGGVELVLDVLSLQKKNAGVFEWGCRCLHNLVHCYEEESDRVDRTVLSKNITSIEEAGGIEIVIDAMSQNITENNAQLWAIKLLWRLLDASGTNDSVRRLSVMHRMVVIRKMAAVDYVSVASKLLRQQSTSGELLVYTAELMTVVILGAGGESNMFKFALLLEKASQCASNMIRAMKQMPNDLEMQAAGCRLLSALCNASGNIQGDMIEQGAMDVIASAMTKLQENGTVVEPGTWALWKLSAELTGSTENIPLEVSSIRNVLKVLGALATKRHQRAIQRAINGFAANVCGMDGLDVDDFPMADLVLGFFHDPLAGGGDVLALLCCRYPDSSPVVLQTLGLEKIVEILNDANSNVQEPLIPILLSAAENSAEARNLLVSSGVLGASVPALGSSQKKEVGMSIVDLISALSSTRLEAPTVPKGLCRTVRSCLENGFSDETSSIKLMQMVVGIVVQSAPSDDLDLLLPWISDKLDNGTMNVAICACNLLWAIAAKRIITNSSRLRELLGNILAFMIRYNGDNGHELVMEVQNAAAGALSGIAACIRNSPIPVEPQQIDCFMGVVYKARPLGEEASGFMAAILVAIWNLCFVHERVLLQAGVIILVIDIMGAYRMDGTVQEKGCLVLAQLASSENIQITLSIVETDGVQMLLEALASFPLSKGVQSEASRALAHLSTDDETRMLVSAMGGINLLVASITSFSDDLVLLERSYSALLNLTSDVHEQFLDFPAIVRAIVTTMAMYPNSTSLRENGLGILQNVCMKGARAKETIAAEGGITTVTNAMENFITTPTVLERSFSTLWSLAVLPANQSRIAEANGINMVVAGMFASIEYERVQQQGCGCMFTLALDPKNRRAFRDVGGVDAVTLSSKAHFGSIGVQLEVCRCLSGLSTPGEGPDQIQSISQDEVNAVVFAMQRFTNVEGVQLYGSTALLNFLYAKNAASLVSEYRDLMKEAVERASSCCYPQCSEVARSFHQRLNELV
ncbi:hypothetical protein ACA910_000768 [Epithemia clementina (nom. ined.)]